MPSASSAPLARASAIRLQTDWRQLCREIGERRAGGAGERRAIDYVAGRFAEAGLSVACEPVACRCLVESRSSVAARAGGRWLKADSLCLVNSDSTPGSRAVEGEIAWIESPESLHRLKPGSLRSKVAVLFGQMPGDTRSYRSLIASRPAAVLQVDDREPFAWPIRNALLPEWVRQFGAPPAAGIAFQTAWKWRLSKASRARVAIAARHKPAQSANVVATLPGTDPGAAAILFGAHHDTPPDVVGADDNASGVVSLLELARIFATFPGRRRPLIFASFGAEEQLSIGSADYVRRHRRELAEIGLVINFDSVSSPLGHSQLIHSGHSGLGTYFQAGLRKRGYDVELDSAINPFSDHFPFTAFGIPAVFFYRPNVRGGQRWQHHSGHDTLANVAPDELCRLLDAVAPIALSLSQENSWPFGRSIPAAAAAETARFARKWYGLRVK